MFTRSTVRSTWIIAEDYPPIDKEYLVIFPSADGKYDIIDADVWAFEKGVWHSLPDSRFFEEEVGLPAYYIDLPVPT